MALFLKMYFKFASILAIYLMLPKLF